METFYALLALCAENSPVTGEFPAQRPVTRSFDVSLICAWINAWVNNRDAGDLRRHSAHYGVIVMTPLPSYLCKTHFAIWPLSRWVLLDWAILSPVPLENATRCLRTGGVNPRVSTQNVIALISMASSNTGLIGYTINSIYTEHQISNCHHS